MQLVCRSTNLVFSTHTIPAALEMQLSKEVKLSVSLPVARLLQHQHWDPQEQKARLTLFKLILRAGWFLSLAVVQLKLWLDRSCSVCTDLPVARRGFEFSSGRAGKQGAGSQEL